MDTVVIVLWIVGLIFVIVALVNIIKRAIKTKRCTARTSAVITGIKEKISTRNDVESHEYIPTITYSVNGQQYSREYAKAYTAATYHVGQTIGIMYNPNKPTEINKQGSSNKADVIIMIIGIVIIVVGIVMFAIN